MPDEETTQQAEQPAEYSVDYEGAGFRAGHPGQFANCRVWFSSTTGEVLRVESLTGVALTPAEPVPEPVASAQPVEQSTVQEQPTQQESNGG